MKFKCGLTAEEKADRTKRKYEEGLSIIKDGQIVFAWRPIRIKEGDCRWLEKVKRFPTRVRDSGYYHSWESVSKYTDHKCAVLYSEGNPFIQWKYEALDNGTKK